MSVSREFDHAGDKLRVQLESLGDGRYRVQVGDRTHEVTAHRLGDGRVRFESGGAVHRAASGPLATGEAAARRGDLHVKLDRETWVLPGTSGGRRARGEAAAGDGVIVAPMTGTVLRIHASVGDSVAASDTVAVVSAMKMEHKLTAGVAGKVAEVLAGEGTTVEQDAVILRIEPAAEAG